MEIRYHYIEPGEQMALIRMADREKLKTPAVDIVITMGKRHFRDLVHEVDLKAALLDFDGTFTRIGKVWSGENGKEECYYTGWQELRKAVGPQGSADLARQYDLFRQKLLTSREFIYTAVSTYQDYGVTRDKVVQTAGSVPFRDGYRELLLLLQERFERRCIISYGLRDWIDCREEFSGFPHEVIASSLIFDETGRVEGVRAGVTDETKGEEASRFLVRNGLTRNNAFALGNSWHDRHLFSAAGISAYLSHGGYKGTEVTYEAEIEHLKSVATAIVFDDTLHGVNDLLQKIVARAF